MSVRVWLFLIGFMAIGKSAWAQYSPLPDIMRGDANGDLLVNIADMIYINTWLFSGGPSPNCVDAADVNDDGQVNVSDVVYLQTYLFLQGPPPPPPYPACGRDPTASSLSCSVASCFART